jgi:hypothetical protein
MLECFGPQKGKIDMTSEKLYETLRFLETLDDKLTLQETLEAILDALKNLTNSPAQPQYQSSLAEALESFEQASLALRGSITPSHESAIRAMGGVEFFDPGMFDKVKNAVQTNAMTPAVARDIVKDLSSRRSAFLKTVRSAKQALEQLNVGESELQTGSADLAFLIPRGIFKNQLGPFAKELNFINRLVEHFSEAITGTAQPAELEQLSSSVPTVALLAAVPVILAIGEVVNKFLEAWEKIEKIRKMRAELGEMGFKGLALDQLTDQVTTTVNEVVEESTHLVLAKYTGDGGRKAELETAIKTDTLRLFGQIERGLTVEIRVNNDKVDGQSAEDQQALKRIEALSKTFTFPEAAQQPMLLQSGEVLEGSVAAVNYSKKTTMQKKTVSKKGTKETTAEVND